MPLIALYLRITGFPAPFRIYPARRASAPRVPVFCPLNAVFSVQFRKSFLPRLPLPCRARRAVSSFGGRLIRACLYYLLRFILLSGYDEKSCKIPYSLPFCLYFLFSRRVYCRRQTHSRIVGSGVGFYDCKVANHCRGAYV